VLVLWEIDILIPIAASSKSTIAALPIRVARVSFFSVFGSFGLVMDFLLLGAQPDPSALDRRGTQAPDQFQFWRPGRRRCCHLSHLRPETKPRWTELASVPSLLAHFDSPPWGRRGHPRHFDLSFFNETVMFP
jgi:hypothetical protein